MAQNQDKPVVDTMRLTIVAGAAGGVGGYREWHYAAVGENETVENLLEEGYFSAMQQLAHQDVIYVAGVQYSASLVCVREEGSTVIKTVKAWSATLPDKSQAPKVQTLPTGTASGMSEQAKSVSSGYQA
jgi:hypothetical protein